MTPIKVKITFSTALLFVIVGALPMNVGAKEKPVDLINNDSFKLLLNPQYFSIGPVSDGGTPSDFENAYKVVFSQKEAIPAFYELLQRATTEGKMYALLGLHRKDPAAYADAVTRYKRRWFRSRKVKVMAGCKLFTMNDLDIISSIEKGDYDKE